MRLARRSIVLRGGADAIVLGLRWVDRAVRMRVIAYGACQSEDVDAAISAGRAAAGVDDDPTDFFAMVADHPMLGPLARGFDPRVGRTPTVFESFAVAVIEQLVTFYEARASVRRLWRIAGEVVPDTDLRASPTASAVRRVPMWRWHSMGVGSRRAATLREGAARGAAMERLRGVEPEVAVRKLQTLAGVGPWTAHTVARTGLGWADAVPIGDFHVPFLIADAFGYGHTVSRTDPRAADEAMLSALAPFRPHRGRVVSMLERSVMSAPRTRPLPRIDPHRREPWRF